MIFVTIDSTISRNVNCGRWSPRMKPGSGGSREPPSRSASWISSCASSIARRISSVSAPGGIWMRIPSSSGRKAAATAAPAPPGRRGGRRAGRARRPGGARRGRCGPRAGDLHALLADVDLVAAALVGALHGDRRLRVAALRPLLGQRGLAGAAPFDVEGRQHRQDPRSDQRKPREQEEALPADAVEPARIGDQRAPERGRHAGHRAARGGGLRGGRGFHAGTVSGGVARSQRDATDCSGASTACNRTRQPVRRRHAVCPSGAGPPWLGGAAPRSCATHNPHFAAARAHVHARIAEPVPVAGRRFARSIGRRFRATRGRLCGRGFKVDRTWCQKRLRMRLRMRLQKRLLSWRQKWRQKRPIEAAKRRRVRPRRLRTPSRRTPRPRPAPSGPAPPRPIHGDAGHS